jgi:hypothetical protein
MQRPFFCIVTGTIGSIVTAYVVLQTGGTTHLFRLNRTAIGGRMI